MEKKKSQKEDKAFAFLTKPNFISSSWWIQGQKRKYAFLVNKQNQTNGILKALWTFAVLNLYLDEWQGIVYQTNFAADACWI